MTILLNSEHEKLVQEEVQNAEFPSVEAVVEFALNRFFGNTNRRDPDVTVEERVRRLMNSLPRWTAILLPVLNPYPPKLSTAERSTKIIGTAANTTCPRET